MPRINDLFTAIPQYTAPPKDSWWLGLSREQLAAKVKAEQARMRSSKGASMVSGLSQDGMPSVGLDRTIRRVGSAR